MAPDYLEYVSGSEHNFKCSLLNVPEAVNVFGRMDRHVTAMLDHLAKLPEISAADAFFFLGTFLAIFQRQSRNAFSLILRRMSYDGLLVSRPGIEAAIFAYRIWREPALLTVWAKRNDDFKAFNQQFRRADVPADMPYREDLEKGLDTLNDYWAHPNINYFSSAVTIEAGVIRIQLFDPEDELPSKVTTLTFLDTCLRVLAVFRRIWADRFGVFTASTEDEYRVLLRDLETLKTRWRQPAR